MPSKKKISEASGKDNNGIKGLNDQLLHSKSTVNTDIDLSGLYILSYVLSYSCEKKCLTFCMTVGNTQGNTIFWIQVIQLVIRQVIPLVGTVKSECGKSSV